MTKQEKIREGLAECHYYYGGGWDGIKRWEDVALDDRGVNYDFADIALEKQASQGVVIKVERELPENPFTANIMETNGKIYNPDAHKWFGLALKEVAGYAAVESLIGE